MGIGGVRLLDALNVKPSIYSMNEGHAAFLGLELLKDELPGRSLEAAIARVRQRVVYTNHTVVPAGNDVFSGQLIREHVVPYMSSVGVSEGALLNLGGGESFSMPILAFHLAGKANAVSHIHADAIRNIEQWQSFPVEAVTNGVHVPTWLGDQFTDLFDRHVAGWHSGEDGWDRVENIPDAELWKAKTAQRASLVSYLQSLSLGPEFSPDALTIVWARRFAQYKRASLLISDIERLRRIVSRAGRPVQIVVAGKAHPKDEGGKDMLQAILRSVETDEILSRHFAFVENYNMEIALRLVGGADIWLNTPRKPLEASGTSGMKAGNNGALHLTVTDGWAAEVDWKDIGWTTRWI